MQIFQRQTDDHRPSENFLFSEAVENQGGTNTSLFFHAGGVTLIVFSRKGVWFAGSMTTLSFPQHLSHKEKWCGAHLHFWWAHHTCVVLCCLLRLQSAGCRNGRKI